MTTRGLRTLRWCINLADILLSLGSHCAFLAYPTLLPSQLCSSKMKLSTLFLIPFVFLPSFIFAATIPHPPPRNGTLVKRGGEVNYLANCEVLDGAFGNSHFASYMGWYSNVDNSLNQQVSKYTARCRCCLPLPLTPPILITEPRLTVQRVFEWRSGPSLRRSCLFLTVSPCK